MNARGAPLLSVGTTGYAVTRGLGATELAGVWTAHRCAQVSRGAGEAEGDISYTWRPVLVLSASQWSSHQGQ